MDKTKLFALVDKAILKNQTDKALEGLERILSVDASDVKALNKAADLYIKKKDFDRALKYLHRVGELYTRDGFFSKAIAIYKRILKIDESAPKSKTVGTHEQLAGLYGQLGLVSDAMNHFKIVVDYFDQEEDREGLLQVLKKVSDLDPNNIESQVKLAELFVGQGKDEEAKETLSRLAHLFESKSQTPDLLQLYERWIDLFPKDFEALTKHVETCIQNSEPKRALSRLQAAFRAEPYNAVVLELLSKTFRSMHQPEKAKAVDVELVKIYRKTEEADKCAAVESRITGEAPPPMPAPTATTGVKKESNLGHDSLDQGESLIRSMDLGADEKRILSECEVYSKYGLLDKAREVFTQQIQKFPKSIALRWKLKSVLSDLDLKDECVHLLSEVVLLAKQQELSDWVKLSAAELRKLDPSNASLAGIPRQEASRQSAVTHASEMISDVASSEGFGALDESEISIVVEDDFAMDLQDEAIAAAEDVFSAGTQAEGAEESEVLDLSEPAVPESEPLESAEEAPEDAFLSEADFTPEELEQLGTQLEPEAKPQEPEEELLDLSEAVELGDSPAVEAPVGFSEPSDVSGEVLGDEEFEVRQVLEEVEFFRSQNLKEEAEQLIAGLKEKFPDYEKYQSVVAEDPTSAAISGAKSAKKEVELEALKTKMKLSVQEDDRPDADGDFFDFAGELSKEFEEAAPAQEPSSNLPAEVQDVFAAFKKGVSESVSEEDFETHFDLGIAYREMELVDEAIGEFLICSKLPGRKVSSFYQLGICEMAKADFKKAQRYFEEALSEPQVGEQERLSLSYELAEVLLNLDQADEARRLFEEVQRLDPEFRDVSERLKQTG